MPAVERHHGFRQFRIVQRARDRVEVLLVAEPDAPETLEGEVADEVAAILGERGVRVECRRVESIPLRGRGKLRCVERDPAVA